MTLYEIDKQLMDIIDAAYDEETGEILNEDLYAQVEALAEAREDKIEGVALWIKNLTADAEAYKAEKDSFARKQKAAENKIKSLKSFLQYALHGEKFKSTKVSISYRRSEQVVVDPGVNIAFLDDQYLRYQDPELDKVAVKEAIKSGTEIPGLSLAENISIQIK